MAEKKTIGVTDCSKYKIYHDWAASHAPDMEVIKLSYAENGLEKMKQCQGIILTGGEDVHPRFYNKPEYLDYCYPDDISEVRDEFELSILSHTEKQGIPLLGICRGLQIANVFFGGTLIPDIPSWGKFDHGKLQDGTDKYHEVSVNHDSWLHGILKTDAGTVNSNHHQSADKIGRGLIVSVLSPDGIAEAIERKHPSDAAFLCLVQWHPERMKNQQSYFVKNIADTFIAAIKNI
ncbi:gamma-glutamyl-gamma-aminobutyrate hydrolase family protein [Chitinophaga niastensis]|uniref:gamma-glutamyl-gamma-aminobutyrate hydrolase family protein n=1 Tax=Chitinophaga niastensis TaxID=536980 RepID=UPI000D0D3376|nr:gamma-glutamyl-gamma-aminobutyrate hydrolase family protein [Chitinophaga niastensis]